MIVVDTSVWVDYFNGRDTPQTQKLDTRLGAETLLIGDLILAELLQGFRTDAQVENALSELELCEFAPMVGRDVALASAANYRSLRRRGITVRKTIDILVATFCIVNGHSLLYDDRDFDPAVQHLGLVRE
jgi:predicted nucleic acid-binding protein